MIISSNFQKCKNVNLLYENAMREVVGMKEEIYFSKIEYIECIGYGALLSSILLNIPERELSYQIFDTNSNMPAIEGIETEEWNGKMLSYSFAFPAKKIRNGKTKFKPCVVKDEKIEQKVVFSYAIQLTDQQMKKLLPYCNALDFEPYRDREMSMKDEGYIGYRDEVQLYFKAITDSYIPFLKLPMDYYYDEEHIWPSERLYRYLIKTFFEGKKQLHNWGATYGGFSLFF